MSIRLTKEMGVAMVTLDRPDKLNALSGEMAKWAELAKVAGMRGE